MFCTLFVHEACCHALVGVERGDLHVGWSQDLPTFKLGFWIRVSSLSLVSMSPRVARHVNNADDETIT